MKRNTIPPKHTILHYTINDTTDSDSITSVLENSNDYKNSDMSYILSSNDDNISCPLNKANNHRGNINHSKNIYNKKILISLAHTHIQKYKISNSAKKR